MMKQISIDFDSDSDSSQISNQETTDVAHQEQYARCLFMAQLGKHEDMLVYAQQMLSSKQPKTKLRTRISQLQHHIGQLHQIPSTPPIHLVKCHQLLGAYYIDCIRILNHNMLTSNQQQKGKKQLQKLINCFRLSQEIAASEYGEFGMYWVFGELGIARGYEEIGEFGKAAAILASSCQKMDSLGKMGDCFFGVGWMMFRKPKLEQFSILAVYRKQKSDAMVITEIYKKQQQQLYSQLLTHLESRPPAHSTPSPLYLHTFLSLQIKNHSMAQPQAQSCPQPNILQWKQPQKKYILGGGIDKEKQKMDLEMEKSVLEGLCARIEKICAEIYGVQFVTCLRMGVEGRVFVGDQGVLGDVVHNLRIFRQFRQVLKNLERDQKIRRDKNPKNWRYLHYLNRLPSLPTLQLCPCPLSNPNLFLQQLTHLHLLYKQLSHSNSPSYARQQLGTYREHYWKQRVTVDVGQQIRWVNGLQYTGKQLEKLLRFFRAIMMDGGGIFSGGQRGDWGDGE